jgi:aldehyde:ferredoxin oxidoreductase
MLLMLHEYYRERGWNEDGIPTRSKLEELGLAREMGLLENAGMV